MKIHGILMYLYLLLRDVQYETQLICIDLGQCSEVKLYKGWLR